jgi:IS4 transposase
VLSDQIVSLPSLDKDGEAPVLFRRIEYWNADKQEVLVFFTNLLHLAASTVAAIYKERWQIELFFENTTWCTPSYVVKFQGSVVLNSAAAGSLHGFVLPSICQHLLCA